MSIYRLLKHRGGLIIMRGTFHLMASQATKGIVPAIAVPSGRARASQRARDFPTNNE